ncbi:hypothetical protein XL14_23850, partial [Salmonella enterica subsp. enterica serovar Paratyphi B]|nr:hypothetical protein [Salmonella enterica subsp. enterica serovar Paratyphi B]
MRERKPASRSCEYCEGDTCEILTAPAYSGLVPEFPYSRLRRWPDVEAENLQAHDATDLLLVERARDSGVDGS